MRGEVPFRQQLSVGSVVFHRDGRYVPLMGDDRVDALRKFYRHQDLGNLVPHGDMRSGDMNRPLKWDDVRWDTAGDAVTAALPPSFRDDGWREQEASLLDLASQHAEKNRGW